MQPDDPTQWLHSTGDDPTEADLPGDWPRGVRDAFWSACNAPTYAESHYKTLEFGRLLAIHNKQAEE